MPPILQNKDPDAPSVFTAEGLLREARRQKRLEEHPVPAVCLLDPDGDIVRQLAIRGLSTRCPFWACYHTDLHRFTWEGIEIGDEGTSYHYLPPSEYSHIPASLLPVLEETRKCLDGVLCGVASVLCGATWTTDAPFRETQAAIDQHRVAGILAVEMEAAAFYAFAQARQKSVVCVAHVTNQMASIEGDFEKGDADGMQDSLYVVAAIARSVSAQRQRSG